MKGKKENPKLQKSLPKSQLQHIASRAEQEKKELQSKPNADQPHEALSVHLTQPNPEALLRQHYCGEGLVFVPPCLRYM